MYSFEVRVRYMIREKIIYLVLIILIFKMDALQAQNIALSFFDSLIIKKEPKVTKGTFNIIKTTVLDTNIKKFFQYRIEGDNEWKDGGNGSTLSYWKFENLLDGTKYWYRIILDSAGGWKDTSNTVYSYQDATPPEVKITDNCKYQN